MEKIIVYMDDPAYALQQLAPMRCRPGGTHWVLVACAPRLTQHVSKWVSHAAREKWRANWSEKVFAEVMPTLASGGDAATRVVAKGSLQELTKKLVAQNGAAHVLDARRPKFAQDLQPVTAGQEPQKAGWEVPGAVVGLGAMLVLAAE